MNVEGLPISTHARVLDEIGTDEEERRIEILIGALAMQEWGIRPLPDEEAIKTTLRGQCTRELTTDYTDFALCSLFVCVNLR